MENDPQCPCIHPAEGQRDTGIDLAALPKDGRTGVYGGVILAVAHDEFGVQGMATLQNFGRDTRVFFDMKSRFPQDESDLRL